MNNSISFEDGGSITIGQDLKTQVLERIGQLGLLRYESRLKKQICIIIYYHMWKFLKNPVNAAINWLFLKSVNETPKQIFQDINSELRKLTSSNFSALGANILPKLVQINEKFDTGTLTMQELEIFVYMYFIHLVRGELYLCPNNNTTVGDACILEINQTE